MNLMKVVLNEIRVKTKSVLIVLTKPRVKQIVLAKQQVTLLNYTGEIALADFAESIKGHFIHYLFF